MEDYTENEQKQMISTNETKVIKPTCVSLSRVERPWDQPEVAQEVGQGECQARPELSQVPEPSQDGDMVGECTIKEINVHKWGAKFVAGELVHMWRPGLI